MQNHDDILLRGFEKCEPEIAGVGSETFFKNEALTDLNQFRPAMLFWVNKCEDLNISDAEIERKMNKLSKSYSKGDVAKIKRVVKGETNLGSLLSRDNQRTITPLVIWHYIFACASLANLWQGTGTTKTKGGLSEDQLVRTACNNQIKKPLSQYVQEAIGESKIPDAHLNLLSIKLEHMRQYFIHKTCIEFPRNLLLDDSDESLEALDSYLDDLLPIDSTESKLYLSNIIAEDASQFEN